MRNLLFEISYNGSRYHGWQVQQNAITVQQVVQDSIERLFQKRLDISGCSRTDTGVHANQYFFHMKTESKIPCNNIQRAMNTSLPDDIVVLGCSQAPLDFHARYSCTGKEYVYQIWNAEYGNPFLQDMVYHYRYPLRIERIQQAMQYLLGTHDFSAFCALHTDVEDKTRTIFDARVEQEGNLIKLVFRGDGFLYNMVRIMVGTLLFVSEGKIQPEQIPEIIQKKDRSLAGKTAPARGLYLNRIFY